MRKKTGKLRKFLDISLKNTKSIGKSLGFHIKFHFFPTDFHLFPTEFHFLPEYFHFFLWVYGKFHVSKNKWRLKCHKKYGKIRKISWFFFKKYKIYMKILQISCKIPPFLNRFPIFPQKIPLFVVSVREISCIKK